MAKSKKPTKTGENFFQKLFSQLFGGNDHEAGKKRQLKAIAKNLSKSRFKFYKNSSEEALPALGKLFWDLYKAISPVQLMFLANENPAYFKNAVVNHSISEAQAELLEALAEESIEELSPKIPFKQLSAKINADCETLMSSFNMEKITKIDALYTKLLRFKEFCMFDFYFLLKKFLPSLRERDFTISPKFNAINASYIYDDLKDFAALVYQLPFDGDWSDLMHFFKAIKGTEPIKPSVWQKIVARMKQVRESLVFDMMIQLISKDPTYQTPVLEKNEHIIESYLDKVRDAAMQTIKKLEAKQKSSKVDAIMQQVFGKTSIIRLKNYTETRSETFVRAGVGSFEYAQPLNCLKEFLVEFVKKDVRTYSDIILVRGQWVTSALTAPMSDAYNSLLGMSDKITEFDEKLAENHDIGLKLKNLSPRLGRDREAQGIAKTLLNDVNNAAKEFLTQSIKNFIIYAKDTKALLDDHQKKHAEMIINWKELDHYAESTLDLQLQQMGIDLYKKIYLFVNLMQAFLG